MKRRLMLIHAFFWGMLHLWATEDQHIRQAKYLYRKYLAEHSEPQ